eukprot:NODE_213_length_14376_cov_0.499054.p4 type:complete len:382 gc:universal NODE_213_length_14376_cov_0.499054:2726-1581(-)
MELEHISQKTGLAKVQQLVFIAQNTKVEEEAYNCLNSALKEIKQSTRNTTLYKYVSGIIKEQGHRILLDDEWCVSTNKEARHQYELIQDELLRDKNNGIKEKIRLSHLDMGHLFFDIGEYGEALKNYIKSKDYSATSEHIVEVCLHLIKVNWMLKNFGSVESFCQKGLVEDANNDQFQAMLGLCMMIKGRYEAAIESFSKVNFNTSNPMIACALSINDISRYGVVCAISSLNRPALIELSKNDNFREYLELEPVYRDLLHLVTQLRYKNAMIQFKCMIDELRMDLYTCDHCDRFIGKLKILSITGVFDAFDELKLSTIGELIGESDPTSHVEQMISSGVLAAKIDARTDTIKKYTEKPQVDIHEVLALAQLTILKSGNKNQ